MSLPVSWHFVWQDQGTAVALSPVRSLCDSWEVWTSGLVEKTMHCVLGGVVSALIGNVLLTGAAQQVYSSGDIAVTFIQSAPAAASPQEAQRRPTWAAGGPQRGEWALFELADAPLSGNFCCLCRKASGGGSGGAAVILGAGWAFSTSPPCQETHFTVSSLCVCKWREGVEVKRPWGSGTERQSSASSAYV